MIVERFFKRKEDEMRKLNNSGNVGIIVLAVVAIIALMFVLSYNSIVSRQKVVENAWADIDAQLQRRADLIPNLVEIIKGYTSYEQDTLLKVVEARRAIDKKIKQGIRSPKELLEAKAALDSQISRLFALVENYPDLKANQNYLALQDQLEGTENRISVARQRYNYAVNRYNSSLVVFPNIIIARMLGFMPKESFEADNDAKKVVSIKF